MPALSKAKHELVAQALAAGKSQREAYEAGGYIYKPANAHRLCTRLAIFDRVNEIVAQVFESEQKAREIAVYEAGINEAWIFKRLKYLTDVSLQGRPLKANGIPTGEYGKTDGPTAVKCLALAARICGLFDHRQLAGSQNEFDGMSELQLDAVITQMAHALGFPKCATDGVGDAGKF